MNRRNFFGGLLSGLVGLFVGRQVLAEPVKTKPRAVGRLVYPRKKRSINPSAIVDCSKAVEPMPMEEIDRIHEEWEKFQRWDDVKFVSLDGCDGLIRYGLVDLGPKKIT